MYQEIGRMLVGGAMQLEELSVCLSTKYWEHILHNAMRKPSSGSGSNNVPKSTRTLLLRLYVSFKIRGCLSEMRQCFQKRTILNKRIWCCIHMYYMTRTIPWLHLSPWQSSQSKRESIRTRGQFSIAKLFTAVLTGFIQYELWGNPHGEFIKTQTESQA